MLKKIENGQKFFKKILYMLILTLALNTLFLNRNQPLTYEIDLSDVKYHTTPKK